MADVQVEDGYTRVANILLEKVSAAKMNGCQHSIVLIVWRYTYGFKRKEHDLSAGYIAKATGYNKRQIEREIATLVSRKILLQKVINGVSRTLGFNKDFDSWDTPGELADGQEADGKYTDGEIADTPPVNKPTVTPGELADQERKSFKENLKSNPTTADIGNLILVNPFRLFETEGFGKLSDTLGQKIGDLIDDYGERWVCEAMKVAVIRGKRNLTYVNGILESFRTSGVDEPWTLEKPKQPQRNTVPFRGRSGKPEIHIIAKEQPGGKEMTEEQIRDMLRMIHRLEEKPEPTEQEYTDYISSLRNAKMGVVG